MEANNSQLYHNSYFDGIIAESLEIDNTDFIMKRNMLLSQSYKENYQADKNNKFSILPRDSVPIKITEKHNDQYLLGVWMMLLKVFFFSSDYIISKYAMRRSNYITPLDLCLGVISVMLPMNIMFCKYQNVNLNVFQYRADISIVLLIRTIIGTINNLCILYAIKFISVGKITLVKSINPLWCAIIAAVLIKEKLTKTTIICTIFACFGIYFLTLNRESNAEDKEFAIVGYFLVFSSAWLFGGVFVCIRYVNSNGLHPLIQSFCVSIGITIQTIIAMSLGILHNDKYDATDLTWLIGVGLANFFGQLWISLANKYSLASKMAPFSNLEVVMWIIADIFWFNYSFATTDIIGIVIVAVWVLFPLFLKNRG